MKAKPEDKMDNEKTVSQIMVQTLKSAIRSNEAKPAKPMKILVDESSMYVNHETGQIYIGGQLVESEPKAVICL